MDETKSDYFIPGYPGTFYHYKVQRADLKDSLARRSDLVRLFKPEFLSAQTKIDRHKWRAFEQRGYCFAGDQESAAVGMAMDVITANGMITDVVVGSVPSCLGTRLDNDFENKFPPVKATEKGGSGC